ncbi:hypothetical protein IFM89_032365 [Coptis chinensis]|uniref:Uncharacterized protein n=1 Tax=Coptis chinensis TaxID=261450 RepID=A0A835HZC0_9MAGN|nr:hypothetical protein IFM89_032365 [Coptis chinensis]
MSRSHVHCSWTWRNALKSRAIAANFIGSRIANGRNTLLWHDLWCSSVPRSTCLEHYIFLGCQENGQALMTNLRLQIPLVSKTVRYCIWSNPEEGISKLNVDGSVSDSGAGIGCTIRLRNDVIVLAFSGSSNKESVASNSLSAIKTIKMIENPPWQYLRYATY